MLSILIVEDEPNYSDTLEMFVDELGYECVGCTSNGHDAQNLFHQYKPDLVLMDINLEGGISGIDLAQKFQHSNKTPIIFITSFEDKETFNRAKETGPSAYLIKPFDPDQLERSIELAMHQAHTSDAGLESNTLLAPSSFFIKERNRLVKIKQQEILWVEVEDKYCILHSKQKQFTLRMSLKELMEKLDSSIFIQTHRSYLVNILEVDDIDTQLFVIHIGSQEIPLGRSHKDSILERLNML